jgi:hypothetical protein
VFSIRDALLLECIYTEPVGSYARLVRIARQHTELLRRRGFALCRVLTEQMEYSRAAEGIEDLYAILAFDPNALRAALDLINEHWLSLFPDYEELQEAFEEISDFDVPRSLQ